MNPTTALITGAAGFVGSHLTDHLLARGCRVVGIDNFLLGRREHLAAAFRHPDFRFVEGNVNEVAAVRGPLEAALEGRRPDVVWHMAANSDIRAGTADAAVDLEATFLTTYHALELASAFGARAFAFASTSAIYGPHDCRLEEDMGPLRPISSYGAMKLASEAILSAATETRLDRAWVFRFPNVVGSRATHGVIYDFLGRLQKDPSELEVLGDGRQEKPYLHVSELIDAMTFIVDRASERWNVFNIGPDGTATTVRYIAEAVVRAAAPGARIRFGQSPQGWPGDVPRFNYSIERLRRLGWEPRLSSTQAVDRAIRELT